MAGREDQKGEGSMKFMGHDIENRDHLSRLFPAFRGDDAWRAIKDGASTPMEVEVHAYNYRNRHTAKVRQRSRLESTKALVDGLDGKPVRATRRKAA